MEPLLEGIGFEQLVELEAVLDAQLLVDVVDVVFHGLGRHEQPVGDLSGAASLEEKRDELSLPTGYAVAGTEVVGHLVGSQVSGSIEVLQSEMDRQEVEDQEVEGLSEPFKRGEERKARNEPHQNVERQQRKEGHGQGHEDQQSPLENSVGDPVQVHPDQNQAVGDHAEAPPQ